MQAVNEEEPRSITPGDSPNGRFGDICNKNCMLLLDLTLCCFQMCIPGNETQSADRVICMF